jgi:DNA-binding beta-propeller fold protein YncE
MKSFSISRCAAATGSALLIALLSVCELSAATNPLNQPRGLALASNGNLYVANSGGNNVLVFNPNYAWVSSKTITAGVDKPTSVAFDSAGNLYVANIGTESVTQYSSAGVQNTAGTITAAINTPEYIAVDGLDNIWVNEAISKSPSIRRTSIRGTPASPQPKTFSFRRATCRSMASPCTISFLPGAP